ncbi:MAG TPA: GAF domain-containing protein, partial [Aggregatilineales bacterium]|nr:GAF domain-containing protein [Aggregatilineales bacterium]
FVLFSKSYRDRVAGIAALYAKMSSAEQEQRALAEALRDITATLSSTLDMQVVMTRILDNVGRVVPHDLADIALIDGDSARVAYARGWSPEEEAVLRAHRLPLSATSLHEMLTNNAALVIADTYTYPGWVKLTPGIRSYVAAPMRVHGQTIGFLRLTSVKAGFFSADHARYLQAFADQAAIAIRNAQVFSAEREQRALAEALRDSLATLSSTLDLDVVMRHILDNVGRVVPHDWADISLIEGDVVRLAYLRGWSSEEEVPLKAHRLSVNASGYKQMLEKNEPLIIADTYSDEGWIKLTPQIRSYVAAPMRVHGQTIGFLQLTSAKVGFYVPDQARYLQAFADQAATAIRNAQVFSAEQEQRALAESLRDSLAALNSTLNLDMVMRRILENVGRVVPHDWAHILRIEGDNARMAYSRGWSTEEEVEIKKVRLPLSAPGVADLLKENAAPAIVPDTNNYPGWIHISPKMRSYAGAAIRVRGQVTGFLELLSTTPGFYGPIYAERLQAFADQAAIAIENAQLYAESLRHADELQGRVERRTAELQRSKDHVEAILNNSSDAILVALDDGSISQANPAFSNLFGYQPDEVPGLSLSMIVEPRYVAALENAIHAAIRENGPVNLELDARSKTGLAFSAEIGMARISNHTDEDWQQKPVEIVCSVRDISSRKRSEQELRRAFEKEKELGEIKSRFVSMASHDLRTPLTVILSSTDLLERFVDPQQVNTTSNDLEKFFTRIRTSVRQMAHLVDDVLTFNKADAGKQEVHRELIDLKSFAQDILEEMTLTAKPQHELKMTLPREDTSLITDRQLLRQILVNLLDNALKYSPHGGEIRFDVRVVGDQVVFQVQDNGIGIPEGDQPHLFEVFHRAANVGTIPGTGLGMPITKRAVDALGGTISFESKVSAGTAFTVSIPINPR